MNVEQPDVLLLRAALRRDLVAAMKERRAEEVAALRTAIAAIDNAEAVEPDAGAGLRASEHFAGTSAGAGSSEAQRRVLAFADVLRILEEQVTDSRAEADRYDDHGRPDAAGVLRGQADVIARYLTSPG